MPPTRKELILAGVVLLAIPLLAEIALRAARVQFDPQLYRPNRELGWVMRPRASGVVTTETKQYVAINERGFHDKEHSYEKPINVFRIAVLGNSWTEALQVPLEKNYCSVLEKELVDKRCFGGKPVEVLNFGVAGYSTAQELLELQQEVWKYQPDLVIVALYPARDIANNARDLNNAVDPERSPYFVYRGNKLVEDDAFQSVAALQPPQIYLQNIGYQINERSRVLQAIVAVQRFGKIRVAMASVKDKAEKSGLENLEYAIYAPPSLPAMETAWKVTEGLLMAIRDEVKAHGAKLWIVTLATRPQVIPDASVRRVLMNKIGVQDFSYADDRIKEFGEREGIPVMNLGPALSLYAETHRVYLNGFNEKNFGAGHWNETGHRVAAETIAAELCKASPSNSAVTFGVH
ncbi:MAG TPA: hypothetical protein VKH45_06950 [Candidatus Acidoferrum sp.]|nr:hypothetical protein [Candidatus Acidoferrum sp.]